MSVSTRPEGTDRRALTYLLPSATGAVWLGLGAAALTGLALTASCTVLLLLTGAPLLAATAVTAAGAAVSCLRLAGRTLLQWAPPAAAQLRGLVSGSSRWALPLSRWGATDHGGADRSADLSVLPECGPMRLHTAVGPTGDADLAVLASARRGTDTVILDIVGTGRYGLLDPHEQDSHLAGWGTSLAILLAAPGLQAATWLTHTRPATEPAVDTALHSSQARMSALQQDYRQLQQAVAAHAFRHQHLLALSFTTTGRRPTASTDAALLEQIRQVATRLLADDLLARPLIPDEILPLLSQLLDPARDDLTCGAPAVVASRRNEWTFCGTDDTVHRSFAITGWPRTALAADWLAPLLHHQPPAGCAHTFTVQARPVATEHASRRARAASAKARLDSADRQRLGFTPAAHSDVDQADADGTEAELVAGYRMADVTALLTLHATSPSELDSASRDLRALAVTLRLDLRPLHGQHADALAATLPAGVIPGPRR